jgi:hypothetical protein
MLNKDDEFLSLFPLCCHSGPTASLSLASLCPPKNATNKTTAANQIKRQIQKISPSCKGEGSMMGLFVLLVLFRLVKSPVANTKKISNAHKAVFAFLFPFEQECDPEAVLDVPYLQQRNHIELNRIALLLPLSRYAWHGRVSEKF